MTSTSIQPKTERNLDGYGTPPIAWARVHDRLNQELPQAPEEGGPNRHTAWLTTVRPDGRPHVMPLGILWMEDKVYFTAGAGTRKAKNLAQKADCVVTIATHDFDLIIEGKAKKVTDRSLAERVAERYRAEGWPASVSKDDASLTAEFSAPSAGPAPWDIYEVTPDTIFAMGTSEPYGATRWRF